MSDSRKRLLRLAKGGRFDSIIGVDADGAPLYAGTGTTAVVLGCYSVKDAMAKVRGGSLQSADGSPAFDDGLHRLLAVLRDAPEPTAPPRVVTRAPAGTEPVGDWRRIAVQKYEAALGGHTLVLAHLERSLAAAIESKSGVGVARRRLAEHRRLRRETIKNGLGVEGYGIGVGPAAVDRRLIDLALAALGAHTGDLHPGPTKYDPCVLLCPGRGMALIMPFRSSLMQ